ncbi:uncharacterized protein V1516DRAFT_699428 [Lipomyces oligophaga]|uniref:uncharacterized protein n=1 Tax=Lipomyces oligophaga TaxID=45792 RepID=UPI0034CF1841
MVGVAGGSRGCLNCRKRKIKCSLDEPICSECIKARLDCPGPRTGLRFQTPTFVDSSNFTAVSAEPTPRSISVPASTSSSSSSSSSIPVLKFVEFERPKRARDSTSRPRKLKLQPDDSIPAISAHSSVLASSTIHEPINQTAKYGSSTVTTVSRLSWSSNLFPISTALTDQRPFLEDQLNESSSDSINSTTTTTTTASSSPASSASDVVYGLDNDSISNHILSSRVPSTIEQYSLLNQSSTEVSVSESSASVFSSDELDDEQEISENSLRLNELIARDSLRHVYIPLQPSPASAFFELFRDHFSNCYCRANSPLELAIHGNTYRSWMDQIGKNSCSISSYQDASSSVLILVSRAFTASHYAHYTNNQSVRMFGLRCFTRAIYLQRKQLVDPDRRLSDDSIIASSILALYEVYNGSIGRTFWHILMNGTCDLLSERTKQAEPLSELLLEFKEAMRGVFIITKLYMGAGNDKISVRELEELQHEYIENPPFKSISEAALEIPKLSRLIWVAHKTGNLNNSTKSKIGKRLRVIEKNLTALIIKYYLRCSLNIGNTPAECAIIDKNSHKLLDVFYQASKVAHPFVWFEDKSDLHGTIDRQEWTKTHFFKPELRFYSEGFEEICAYLLAITFYLYDCKRRISIDAKEERDANADLQVYVALACGLYANLERKMTDLRDIRGALTFTYLIRFAYIVSDDPLVRAWLANKSRNFVKFGGVATMRMPKREMSFNMNLYSSLPICDVCGERLRYKSHKKEKRS